MEKASCSSGLHGSNPFSTQSLWGWCSLYGNMWGDCNLAIICILRDAGYEGECYLNRYFFDQLNISSEYNKYYDVWMFFGACVFPDRNFNGSWAQKRINFLRTPRGCADFLHVSQPNPQALPLQQVHWQPSRRSPWSRSHLGIRWGRCINIKRDAERENRDNYQKRQATWYFFIIRFFFFTFILFFLHPIFFFFQVFLIWFCGSRSFWWEFQTQILDKSLNFKFPRNMWPPKDSIETTHAPPGSPGLRSQRCTLRPGEVVLF